MECQRAVGRHTEEGEELAGPWNTETHEQGVIYVTAVLYRST